MGTLVSVLIFGALCAFAFKTNIFLGIAVIVIGLVVLYYVKYSDFSAARGNAEFMKGNTDKAFNYYEKAYKSKNRKYTVDISYAQALLRAGKPGDGLEIINQLLGLRITKELRHSAKQTRAMINYKLGHLDEAYDEVEELFEEGFINSNMYCLKGYLMLLCNNPADETLKFCEVAYDYDDDNRDNVDNLIMSLYRTGDLKKASELCDTLLEAHPQFVEAHYHGALVYDALGNQKRALEFMEGIEDCKRTYMTTVSAEEIQEMNDKLKARK